MSRVRRRQILIAASAILAAPLIADAQQAKVYRVAAIAMVSPLSDLTGADPISPGMRAFVHRLRDLGYVQGRNLVLDIRTLEGRFERSEEVAADIVRLKPDVIFIGSSAVLARALKVTGGVPIVAYFYVAGLVESGLVQSLAHPGGTVTGLITDVDAGTEVKRLEYLREIMPKVKRVAFLGTQAAWDSPQSPRVRAAAAELGLELFHAGYMPADPSPAFAVIERERPDAVFVPTGAVQYSHREKIGQFVAAKRIPCTCAHSEIVQYGCLMSYGHNTDEMQRRMADYVARILQGTKPGDLPIEQPRVFELVINMKTAKALGIKIPQTILLRADRVIE